MTLQVLGGTFSYGNNKVFDDLDFIVNEREILAILGPNGAGKTTLLRCIMNMLPWTSGRALLDGEDICDIPAKALWRRVSYVPQAHAAPFGFSIRQMIVMGRSAHLDLFAQPGELDYSIADHILDEFRIAHLKNQACNRVSGGELQLALIGRAIAAEPDLLIMDEPETNLDYHNQLRVLELIMRLSQHTSCIVNTHFPEHALKIAHKALLLPIDGPAQFGESEKIITERNLEKVFRVCVHIGDYSISNHSGRYIVPISVIK